MEDLTSDEALFAELVANTKINDLTTVRGLEVSQLMTACLIGSVDYVETLLEAPGIRVDLQNHKGYHALLFASTLGHTEIVQLLLSVYQDPSHLINLPDNQRETAIVVASRGGLTETISLLLQNGAHVNMQNNRGTSSLIIASQNGHSETVFLLLQNGAHVNMQNNNGTSSLIAASQNGHFETVSLLLQNGAHVNMQNNEGTSSLIIASKNGHTETVSLLLQNGANLHMHHSSGATALMVSCLESTPNHMKISQLLVACGANINVKLNITGYTPLMTAISKKNVEAALYLIACGADLNIVSATGSALNLATIFNQVSVVKAMIGSSQGVDIDYQDPSGYTSLMIASSRGYTEIVRLLLEAGANVNFSNLLDYSSLHLPLHDIKLTADAELSNIRGSVLDIAVIRGHVETVSLLLQDGAKIHNIFYLLSSITLAQAKASAEKDACRNKRRRQQRKSTILGAAIGFGAGVGSGVGTGAEAVINAACGIIIPRPGTAIGAAVGAAIGGISVGLLGGGTTSLTPTTDTTNSSDSAWERYSAIIRLLFSCNSDLIERVHHTKPSCLYTACAFGVLEMASLLLDLGINVHDLHRTTDDKSTYWSRLITIICSGSLLSSAASKATTSNDVADMLCQVNWLKHVRILSLLIEDGLDINHQDSSGSSALSIASREGHTDLAKFLLHIGRADVNLQDKEGISSLMQASSGGHLEICRCLLRYRAEVNLQDKKGWSALMLAVAHGDVSLISLQLEKGAQINLQDVTGTSSLMLSSFAGQTDVVRVLLNHDAQVNLQNNDGITALMMSSYSGHTEIVKLLIQHGADLHIETHIGITALRFSSNTDITELLRQHGATDHQQRGTLSARTLTVSSTSIITFLRSIPKQDISLERLEEILKTLSENTAVPELSMKPTLADSYKTLLPIAYSWKSIGVFLGLDYNMLKNIEYNNHHVGEDCLMEMLGRWLKQVPTWEELAEAVEHAQHHDIAHIIRKSHEHQNQTIPA